LGIIKKNWKKTHTQVADLERNCLKTKVGGLINENYCGWHLCWLGNFVLKKKFLSKKEKLKSILIQTDLFGKERRKKMGVSFFLFLLFFVDFYLLFNLFLDFFVLTRI